MPPGHEKFIASAPTACAVCGTSLRGKRRVLSREYLSEVYSFCSEVCAQQFLGNPEEFMENGEEEEE